MGSRGKKSTAGIVVQAVPTLRRRLSPPADLTDEQAAIWRAVVASRPVDWFDAGSAPLLVAYCRTADVHRVLAAAMDLLGNTKKVSTTTTSSTGSSTATNSSTAEYRQLLAAQDATSRMLIKLATALRLSPHSRRSVGAAATAARDGQSAAKLWE
jgi:phage terminase small subunit